MAAGRREATQAAQLRKALDRLAKSERLAAGEMQLVAQVPAVKLPSRMDLHQKAPKCLACGIVALGPCSVHCALACCS